MTINIDGKEKGKVCGLALYTRRAIVITRLDADKAVEKIRKEMERAIEKRKQETKSEIENIKMNLDLLICRLNESVNRLNNRRLERGWIS